MRRDGVHAAADDVPGQHADAAAAVDREVDREELLVDRHLVLEQLLVEHVDQDVAGDVGRVDRARRAGGAERALRDAAVGEAREHGAHVLELVDVARSLRAHDLDRVLVAQVVGALDRVERVDLGAVLGGVAERRVDAALGRAGVGARRVQLRDDRDVGAGALGFDCGAHAGKARTDHHDVVPKQRSSRSEGQKGRAEAPLRIIEVACPGHDRRSGDCGTAGSRLRGRAGAGACARARRADRSGAEQRPAGRVWPGASRGRACSLGLRRGRRGLQRRARRAAAARRARRLLGLEVRYLDGTPCDGRAAVIRNAFRFLDWFPGVYMIGGFAIASTRRRQRLGDQAAGTSVYRRADLAARRPRRRIATRALGYRPLLMAIASATTAHAALRAWVEDWTAVLEPERVHWCDGSDEEHEQLCAGPRRRRDVHAPRRRAAAELLLGALRRRATSRASRTARSSAASARRTPGRPTTGAPPTRCAPRCARSSRAPCAAARSTSCRSRWARSARRSRTSACSSPTRPTSRSRCG